MKKFNIIAAIHETTRGIGLDGKLPWHLPQDLQRFKKITQGGTVIMGRKTWQSLPRQTGLPGRQNIVITRTPAEFANKFGNVQFVSSLNDAIKLANEPIFVIGGGDIYREAINRRDCQKLYLTLVSSTIQSFDTFFPKFTNEWICSSSEQVNESVCRFTEWLPICHNAEEEKYLTGMEEILQNNVASINRTGVDALVKFGATFRFDLRGGKFPLQTTRHMWLRGIFEEFKWIISGDTNANNLAAKGVNIWLPNTTREFLDQRGLHHYEPGDIGPTYGFNMRHYGAKYYGMNHTQDKLHLDELNFSGYPKNNALRGFAQKSENQCGSGVNATSNSGPQGVDQLQTVIDQLRNDPTSRRIIIDLWDQRSVGETALPPCMFLYTFWYNQTTNELNLHVNQRSSDFFIARNWNDTFAALFLICVSKIVKMQPGELVVTITNAHIYTKHLEQVDEQLKRKPYPFPTLEITRDLDSIDDILQLNFKDLKLSNYISHPGIKADMVV